ncbi:MAG: PTS system mannose/fructose/N-acetylgalactosamine-transporter subunit IIB [Traorella sp.]
MIKMLRVDDNLLHGQIAFSWVRNLKIHTIIIADDKVVNDQFMKMTLGLAKPNGVNLMILSIEETIRLMKEDSKLNILLIVGNLKNAYTLCQSISQIHYVNIGLIRKKQGNGIQYESMYLSNEDILICKDLEKKDIFVEYRLRYEDKPVLINELINSENKS